MTSGSWKPAARHAWPHWAHLGTSPPLRERPAQSFSQGGTQQLVLLSQQPPYGLSCYSLPGGPAEGHEARPQVISVGPSSCKSKKGPFSHVTCSLPNNMISSSLSLLLSTYTNTRFTCIGKSSPKTSVSSWCFLFRIFQRYQILSTSLNVYAGSPSTLWPIPFL